MIGDAKGECSNCYGTVREGDVIFSIDIGRVMSDSTAMLPLGAIYCVGCVGTKLNMTTLEMYKAVEALDAHVAKCR